MRFATNEVLSTSTGRLLGKIDGVYKVVSFLVGRSVFSHELVTYGMQAAAALKAAIPALPSKEDAEHVTGENYKAELAKWEAKFGPEIDLPDHLRECLADDRTAIDTARDLVPGYRIINLNTDK